MNNKKQSAKLFSELSNVLGPIVGAIAFQVASKALGDDVSDEDMKYLHLGRSKRLKELSDEAYEKRKKAEKEDK